MPGIGCILLILVYYFTNYVGILNFLMECTKQQHKFLKCDPTYPYPKVDTCPTSNYYFCICF